MATVAARAQEPSPEPAGATKPAAPDAGQEEDSRSPLEKELEKLYRIDLEVRGQPLTFERLADLLVRTTRAPRKGGKDSDSPEFEISYATHERDGLVMRPAGRVGIAYGRSYKTPRSADAKECEKRLNVGGRFSALGTPLRSIHYELEITVTDQPRGRGKPVKYGAETIDFRIVESPDSRSLHLIVDEASYLKHRKRVEDNVVEPAASEIDDELEAFRKKQEEEGKSGKKQTVDPLSITRIEDFRLQSSSIVIDFQRRWERDEGSPVRGTLRVRLNGSLSSELYYAPISDDPDARTPQVKVAYFIGGRPTHLKR